MKKFLLNCGIYLGVAISAVSCSKDDDQPQALSNKDEFSVSEARTFFERNADVMRPLDLSWGHRPDSVADLSQSDMVPLWSQAQAYGKAGTGIVEVPLQVYGAYRAYAHFADKNKAGYMADGEVIVHLVIEKVAGAAAPSCFITSFIPDKDFVRGGWDKAEALRLFLEAEPGYTGLVIRSEMDGKLRGGLMYEGGKISGRLRLGESVRKDKEQGRLLLGMVNVATKGGEGGGGTGFHGNEYEGARIAFPTRTAAPKTAIRVIRAMKPVVEEPLAEGNPTSQKRPRP